MKNSSVKSSSLIHRNSIMKKKRHVCNICSKSYETVHSLLRHQTIHREDNPNLCPYCGKAFCCQPDVRRHMTQNCKLKRILKDSEYFSPVKKVKKELPLYSNNVSPNKILKICLTRIDSIVPSLKNFASYTNASCAPINFCTVNVNDLDLQQSQVQQLDDNSNTIDDCRSSFLDVDRDDDDMQSQPAESSDAILTDGHSIFHRYDKLDNRVDISRSEPDINAVDKGKTDGDEEKDSNIGNNLLEDFDFQTETIFLRDVPYTSSRRAKYFTSNPVDTYSENITQKRRIDASQNHRVNGNSQVSSEFDSVLVNSAETGLARIDTACLVSANNGDVDMEQSSTKSFEIKEFNNRILKPIEEVNVVDIGNDESKVSETIVESLNSKAIVMSGNGGFNSPVNQDYDPVCLQFREKTLSDVCEIDSGSVCQQMKTPSKKGLSLSKPCCVFIVDDEIVNPDDEVNAYCENIKVETELAVDSDVDQNIENDDVESLEPIVFCDVGFVDAPPQTEIAADGKYNTIKQPVGTLSNGSEMSFGSECIIENELPVVKDNIVINHITETSGFENDFTCVMCGTILASRKTLSCHVMKPHDYRCDTCIKRFTTKASLARHHSKNHQVRVNGCHNCHICDKTFQLKSSLKRHFMIHRNDNPFLCKCCGKVTSSKWDLKKHLMKVHLVDELDVDWLDSLTYVSQTNSTDFKGFPCRVCDKQFNDSKALLQHNEIHKVHRCFLCDRTFTVLLDLKKHMTRHLVSEPEISSLLEINIDNVIHFPCRECGKQFVNIEDLIGHAKMMGHKIFSCPDCDRVFQLKSSLKRHFNLHKADNPFICKCCGKPFATNWDLKKHMSTHKNLFEINGFRAEAEPSVLEISEEIWSVSGIINDDEENKANINLEVESCEEFEDY